MIEVFRFLNTAFGQIRYCYTNLVSSGPEHTGHFTYAEPERYGQEEPNGERDRDHLVRRVRAKHLRA